MTNPHEDPSTPIVAPERVPMLDPDEIRHYVAPLARAILAHALALGLAADLLLRNGFTGLGFPLWIALVAASTLSLAWRDGRRLSHETGAWLVVAVLFAIGMAWRDAGQLQFLDFLATLFALGMAAIALGDPRVALRAARMRDTAFAGMAILRAIAAGFVPLAWREMSQSVARQELRGRFRPILRASLIALPLLIVFGSLLRGADPVFASIIALPALDIGTIASHTVMVGFFTWVVAGWARGALITEPARRRAPEQLPFGLAMLDVTTALGVLIGLFALYVATQLGWFFGGERFLRARTGLTAAAYAREGFFQMVWVVALVVPVLVGTRAALRPGRDLERRHTALALPLIALVGAMILSAVLRMRLYVHFYGLTTDRFYALVLMGWLAVVLVWLSLTVLRGEGRSFAAGAVVTGLATLAALNVAAPDVIVAGVNIARAQRPGATATPALDVGHLAQLSGEAASLAVAAALAPSKGAVGSAERLASDLARCTASRVLLARWRPSGEVLARRELDGAAWRSWNRGAASAARVVDANAPALRGVRHATCLRRSQAVISPAGR